MQISRLILFLILVFSVSSLLGSQTIDNDAKLILEGQSQANQIIKIKVYNANYTDDEYFSFIQSDAAGKYELTKSDIDLSRLKDGVIVFELSTNEEELSQEIATFRKTLDKGLLLKISLRSADEFVGDKYINRIEESNFVLEGETETNIKELYITLSDENSTQLSYTLDDVSVDENGLFKIEGIDFSNLVDGKINILASGIDVAGNKVEVSLELIKDTIVLEPKLVKKIKNNNLSNVLNKKILVASGTAEANAVIYFEFRQNDVIVNESVIANSDGSWELLGADLDVSVFENSRVNVAIYQIDEAYNKSDVYEYTNEKFKRPIFPIVPIEIDPQKYQLIYTIDGHSDEIKDIFITQTEIFVATYGYIKVWGKRYAKLQREVELKNVWVNSLVVDSEKVYAGLSNGNINVYDEKTLELLHIIKVDTLAILQLKLYDAKLVSSSASGMMKIYDTNTYEELHAFKNHQWDVSAMAIDGDKLYSGSDDYSIKIFDLKSMKLIKTIKSAHSGTINDILVYNGMIISASDDKTIVLRDAQSGEEIGVFKKHKKAVNKLKIVSGFLVSVSSDRSMIFWDIGTGEVLKRIKAHSKKIDALEVNDFNIVTGSRDHKLKIWGYDDSVEALDSEDETKKAKYSLLKSLDLKNGLPTSLEQNENDIIVSTDEGYIFFYNKTTHDFVKEYTTLDEIAQPVVRTKDEDVESDDEEDEEADDEEREFIPVLQKIYDTTNYGNKLLCALEDSSIKVWDMETDKAVSLLVGNELAITDIKLSPTNILAASKKGNIGVYDIESGNFINLIEGHQYNVNSIAIYEDDKVVSAGDDYSIKIRDIESGDLILDIKNAHDDVITKVLVYKNYLISASLDNTIKIRNILDGKIIKILEGHTSGVTSLVVDEENLISTSKDNTLIAWSMKDFTQLAIMAKHKSAVVDVMITDDYIISISEDKTLKVWKYYE